MEAQLLTVNEGSPGPSFRDGSSSEILNFCWGRSCNPHPLLFDIVLCSPLTHSNEDHSPELVYWLIYCCDCNCWWVWVWFSGNCIPRCPCIHTVGSQQRWSCPVHALNWQATSKLWPRSFPITSVQCSAAQYHGNSKTLYQLGSFCIGAILRHRQSRAHVYLHSMGLTHSSCFSNLQCLSKVAWKSICWALAVLAMGGLSQPSYLQCTTTGPMSGVLAAEDLLTKVSTGRAYSGTPMSGHWV